MPDHYEILEVNPLATSEEILEQYHFLVQAWHPDKFASPESKAKAEEKLKRINEAKTVLLDPVMREDYDRLRQAPQTASRDRPQPARETDQPTPGEHATGAEPLRATGRRAAQPENANPLWNTLILELAAGVTLEFVRVPAGKFLMGSTEQDGLAYPDEQPQHEVSLPEYLIGKYLVTNRQYQAFLNATRYSHWEHGTVPVHKENHPVVAVSWQDAVAFCEWASALSGLRVRLPSEAEWEKAARGAAARVYPWGNQPPDASLLNYNRQVGNTTPVGAYPGGASPCGALNMAGNAWEWVNDIYGEHYYAHSPEHNPPGPASGEYRVLRGGSWSSVERSIRAANRLSSLPGDAGYGSGFRCARDPA